ncbi:hypothetical protein [Streptococcus suis]|uniref:hypothetical protein n=1 Tax=Streptococcus suis TaxID=1307 RepID=UPI00209BF7BA|nr:hypothetical protein [Streptococcus suis]MCO8232461.1 hypothetical protein [Streptococcus suis]HEM3541628.1 hypothetical protein [Streptococcus suis]
MKKIKGLLFVVFSSMLSMPIVVLAQTTSAASASDTDWKTWLTLAASLAAAFGTAVNIFFQRRNHKESLKAQVLAKARIEWMKEVREVFTQFIERSADYEFAIVARASNKQDKAVGAQCKKSQSYFWASYHHLITYFPDSSDTRNQRVRETFENLVVYLDEFHRHIDEDGDVFDFQSELPILQDIPREEYYDIVLKNCTSTLGKYLKEEWDKAKNEALGKTAK